MSFLSYEVSGTVKFIETEGRIVVMTGSGQGKVACYC